MSETTHAAFTIDLQPADPVVANTQRFEFHKSWSGGMQGSGSGVMLSAGDPSTGSAGYVAIETFTGSIGGRSGSLAFQQFGTMSGGDPVLRYEVVPGSGTEGLAGVSGTIELDVVDGEHRVRFTYVS